MASPLSMRHECGTVSTPIDESVLLGASPAMARVRAFAARAASVDATVLLTGESGTGKTLVARCIHAASARAGRAFVAVNCAGVPESLFESEFFGHTRGAFTGALRAHRGLWEQAEAGTLLLDEIGELVPSVQAKLLGVLEQGLVRRVGGERERRVDVRIIAATNADLAAAVRLRRFRADLFHRLQVLCFTLPPLRERGDDVMLLARHFLQDAGSRYRRPAAFLHDSAVAEIRRHRWPGNVRELAHAMEAAVLARNPNGAGAAIRADDLPDHVLRPAYSAHGHDDHGAPAGPVAYPDERRTGVPRTHPGRYRFEGTPDEERERVARALREWRGNRTRTAAALGMSRTTLRKKLRELGVEEEGV